jgi:ABC-type dipeptide/oligopeptide/nickel transport system permease subunit
MTVAGWWRTAGWPERLSLGVLALCLVVGLLGGRWWPVTDAVTGYIHQRSAIELMCGGDADRTDPAERLLPPLAHTTAGELRLFGTDELGRSLALRIAAALGTSLVVACAAAVVAMVIGTAWGAAAALLGGRWDGLLMRLSEVSAGVPAVVVIIVLVSALSAWGATVIFSAMGLLYWQSISRVVRAQVLRLRAEAYVEASRALGAGPWHRWRVHLLPGLMPTIFTYGALLLPRLVMLESLLSYLGVSGTAGPHSFGRIIAGVTATLTPLSRSWWPVLVPCLVLAVFLLALNLVLDARAAGDGERPR